MFILFNAYGIIAVEEEPDFMNLFTDPAALSWALSLYLFYPIIRFIIGFVFERILICAENCHGECMIVFYFIYGVFLIALIATSIALLTENLLLLEITLFLWCSAFLTSIFIISPIIITISYFARKYVGIERNSENDKKNRVDIFPHHLEDYLV
jgi:hypothetical protein